MTNEATGQVPFEDASIFSGVREWIDSGGIFWRARRDGDTWEVSECNSGGYFLVAVVSLDSEATPRQLWVAARQLMDESEAES
jgi:hypothetical protein